MNTTQQTLNLLRNALGDQAVLTGDAINIRHHSDWSQHAPACPLAVILPKTTQEVATALSICNEQHQAIVPQGGTTGLTAGAEPKADQIVLSLEKMVGVEEIDSAASTLTVKAGTSLEVVQQMAADAGFLFPLDLGARGSCQIGGNISTNAGGNNVIRYGMCRDLVLGLEVVLADGRILNLMNKMIKNNAGYDLKQCFIGSEGTLGVITRAVLKLSPRPKNIQTILCALPDYSKAVSLLHHIQQELGIPLAYEVMWQDFYRLSTSWLPNTTPPLDDSYPLFVLIDITTSSDLLEQALQDAFTEGTIIDAVIASSHQQAKQLWTIREATNEFPIHMDPLNFDISIPIGEIGLFAQNCKSRIEEQWPNAASYFFGHIGDSNLHLTIDGKTLPTPTPLLEVEELVYSMVGDMHGSISAEHGIGLLKRDFLHYSVDNEALSVMKELKKAFDPKNILNPGKVLK